MKKHDKNLVFLFLISLCCIVFGLKMEVANQAHAELGAPAHYLGQSAF